MKDKAFLSLSALFFLIFFVGVAIVTLDKPTSVLLRAKSENASALKSFAVAFPQVGPVGSQIKVSVYVRDNNGGILANRPVKLSGDKANLTITPTDAQNTNNIGMAEFFITSPNPGKVQLTALDTNSNTTIVNIPSVEFR